jgi:hypothetical protein
LKVCRSFALDGKGNFAVGTSLNHRIPLEVCIRLKATTNGALTDGFKFNPERLTSRVYFIGCKFRIYRVPRTGTDTEIQSADEVHTTHADGSQLAINQSHSQNASGKRISARVHVGYFVSEGHISFKIVFLMNSAYILVDQAPRASSTLSPNQVDSQA